MVTGRVLVPGIARLQCRTRWRDRRALIAATSPLVWYELRGGSERSFAFSLGRPPDGYTPFTEPIGGKVSTFVVRDQPPMISSAEEREWLLSPVGQAAVGALDIVDSERVTVFSNGLEAELSPDRDLARALDALTLLMSIVPSIAPTAVEGDEELPAELRGLLVLYSPFAETDDAERQRLIGDPKVGAMLRARIEPLIPTIDTFLRSFGRRPWSEAAIQVAALAELTAELRHGERAPRSPIA